MDRTYSVVTPAHLRAFRGNPNYRKNQERARYNGSPIDESRCCVLCGKASFGTTYVLLSNMGEYITLEESRAHEASCEKRGLNSDDLGYYPVGSDCAKTLKSAGIPVYENPKFGE